MVANKNTIKTENKINPALFIANPLKFLIFD